MKNRELKGIVGALAVAGFAYAAKKAIQKRSFFKELMDEFDVKEKSPLAFADKIREMDEEKYNDLKERIKSHFSSKCCCKDACKTESANA